MDESSLETLEEQLTLYKDQFQQVEVAIKAAPTDDSLVKLKSDLLDVINLTQDLIKLKKSSAVKELDKGSTHLSNVTRKSSSSMYPVGTTIMARYHEDGLWYEAKVDSIKDDKYWITFVDYGNQSLVTQDETKPLTEEDKKKRKEPSSPKSEDEEEENTPKPTSAVVIPKSLKILPTDSEEVRQAKKRRMKAIKSQNRSHQLEEAKKEKKNAWQEFSSKSTGKPTKGFLTSTKRESIFKSPDSVTGKVGVVGSGKGVTPSPTFKVNSIVII
jgi:survival-of-motor-neuron-related-splicing factor 30